MRTYTRKGVIVPNEQQIYDIVAYAQDEDGAVIVAKETIGKSSFTDSQKEALVKWITLNKPYIPKEQYAYITVPGRIHM